MNFSVSSDTKRTQDIERDKQHKDIVQEKQGKRKGGVRLRDRKLGTESNNN
jgi:hypothetical protein